MAHMTATLIGADISIGPSFFLFKFNMSLHLQTEQRTQGYKHNTLLNESAKGNLTTDLYLQVDSDSLDDASTRPTEQNTR